ncbi:MAG: hypothetical protein WBG36_17365 [Ornithinimicrobium sp.]
MNATGSGPERRPDTVQGWRAKAAALLSPPCCAFHRNVEISSKYAWLYRQSPERFKWAAMAAIASHHIRLVLFPLRLDTDRSGYIDLPRTLSRRGRLTEDANTIRETNNAIFADVFWVHLAYLGYSAEEDGLDQLRRLLRPIPHYACVLAAFETIDRGCVLMADETMPPSERRRGEDMVWEGNVSLLDHEQRAVVQPHFDRLSRPFVRMISMGATTAFEVRGVRQEVRYFTSFYLHSFTSGLPHALRTQAWPRITRLEDRWRWLETGVVPRFRRLDASPDLIGASLTRVVDEARHYADTPCVMPAGD